jgi:hypothetical protein
MMTELEARIHKLEKILGHVSAVLIPDKDDPDLYRTPEGIEYRAAELPELAKQLGVILIWDISTNA